MTADEHTVPEFRLEVGGSAIALRCPQPGLAEGLAKWFGLPSADPSVPAPVSLELTLVAHDDSPSFPRSLLTTKRLLPAANLPGASGTGFDIANGLITGWYNAADGRGAVHVKAALLDGRYTRIFEQLLYQAYASARQRLEQTAWLVHSSAVIADGQGFLFVGPSEAGKSTVAKLSSHLHVLGDEMNLLAPRAGGGWDLIGTPFNGLFRARKPGRAPLRAVLLLEHGSTHELAEVPAAEAVTRLGGEIVPFVGLDQVPGPQTLPDMIDAAGAVAAETTLKVMRFTPDSGFWPLLAARFALAGLPLNPTLPLDPTP